MIELSANALKTLKSYTMPGEKPQDIFKRVATAYGTNTDHKERMLEYMENKWFMPASPILLNGGTDRGLPISCYLNYCDDSREGIATTLTENLWMGTNGGGIGTYFGAVRSKGQITSRGIATTGALQFMHIFDSLKLAANQGARQAANAIFFPVDHPEIEEFIYMKKMEGDIHRKNEHLDFGVCLPDAFMEAVRHNQTWDLVDPHSKQVVKTVNAADIWEAILEMKMDVGKGEPYIMWPDRANAKLHPDLKAQGLKVHGSNLCVAPETQILTDIGWVQISDAAHTWVNVWTGAKFAKAYVDKTSDRSELLEVTFSDGSKLECTEYHKFHIQKGYLRGTGSKKLQLLEVPAHSLKPGDKIQKCDYPVIDFPETFDKAYTRGFYAGDGSDNVKGSAHIDLYGTKKDLIPHLNVKSVQSTHATIDRQRVLVDNFDKFEVPFKYSIQSRVDWFAGLCDADGTVCLNENTPALQVSSINFDFLNNVRLMLQTMGIHSKVTLSREAGVRVLPDGHGGSKEFETQNCYRLLLGAPALVKLKNLGFNTHRIQIFPHMPNRDASQFVKVVSVERKGRFDATYCFNEPESHKGLFNGVLAGNCVEILLPTGPDYTNVCCLSSVIVEQFDEWENHPLFIADCIEFLDNVMEDFIERCPKELSRARKAAIWERSLGLGQMGLHSYTQKHMMPWGATMTYSYNRHIAKTIYEKAWIGSQKLAGVRGPAKGLTSDRNAHLIAIAPNAKTAIFANTSPTIEPWDSNYFIQDTTEGSLATRNDKYLGAIIENRYGNKADDAWIEILQNEGSVQTLDKLTDDERAVFRTPYEMDQRILVKMAADRQPFICQSQSLNVFFPPQVDRSYVDEVFFQMYDSGLKTQYYTRTKSSSNGSNTIMSIKDDGDCVACSG